jgi:8-oxo-dGTP diphosphatase
MNGPYTYPFPAHYITADIVAFTFRAAKLHVLLIERGNAPFRGSWALPGGFMKPDEELDACARRELMEETSLKTFFLEQFTTVGTIGRDPRGRVVTVAFLALVRWEAGVRGGTDARDARWFSVEELPRLAFDHGELIARARLRLERMLVEQPMLLLRFLPEEFTIEEMQAVQGAVLARTPERRSFYRRASDLGNTIELRQMKIPAPPRRRR